MSSVHILYELYYIETLFYTNNSCQVLCKQYLQESSYVEKKNLLVRHNPSKESKSALFFW